MTEPWSFKIHLYARIYFYLVSCSYYLYWTTGTSKSSIPSVVI